MKRLLPLFLILLLIPCLAVPASASTQGVIDAIWDTHDELGEWLGTTLGDLRDLLTDTVDYLGWIDQEVSSIETNVLKILQEIYTQGTLTIGECVKGIRSYIVQINDKLETGTDWSVGQFIAYIRDDVGSIMAYVHDIWQGKSSVSKPVVDKAEQTMDDLEDMENVLATSPTIDDSGVDSAITGVNGKFQNITNDADGTVFFGSLGEIARSNIFVQLIPTSAMLGVLSFALFGRVF